MLLPILIKNLLIAVVVNAEINNCSECWKKQLGVLTIDYWISLWTLSPGLREHLHRWKRKTVKARGWKVGLKCCLLDMMLQTWTHSSSDYLNKTYIRTRQSNFHQGQKRGSKVPSPEELILQADGRRGRESQFSLPTITGLFLSHAWNSYKCILHRDRWVEHSRIN